MVNGDPLPSKGLLIDSQGPWHKSYDVNIDIDIKIDIVIYIYTYIQVKENCSRRVSIGEPCLQPHTMHRQLCDGSWLSHGHHFWSKPPDQGLSKTSVALPIKIDGTWKWIYDNPLFVEENNGKYIFPRAYFPLP